MGFFKFSQDSRCTYYSLGGARIGLANETGGIGKKGIRAGQEEHISIARDCGPDNSTTTDPIRTLYRANKRLKFEMAARKEGKND